ncbi:MAG: DUF2244 domain-containing protein [Magnetovibrionaceae bacterium]
MNSLGNDQRDLLDLTLRPHRSAKPEHMALLIWAIGGVWFVVAWGFFAVGAWPVVGFIGLDVALLWLALRWNRLSAHQYERIRLRFDELLIDGCTSWGKAYTARISAFFLSVTETPKGILLRQRGETLMIGGFLHPSERHELALRLQLALTQPVTGLRDGDGI